MVDDPLKLSPTSAVEFKNCPQRFKYRVVDQVAEPPSPAAARGSLVHAVLERLFSEVPETRTRDRAVHLLEALWDEVRGEPEFADVAPGDEMMREGRRLLGNYFMLEDPTRVNAKRLEWRIQYDVADLQLRGIIDRVEQRADGSWILTDYKTGRVPRAQRELQAFFGLRFYALVCWRAFGVIPREIRLVYLAEPVVIALNPYEGMLNAFERQMHALANAIRRAVARDDWRPRPSPLCMSCAFQAMCPAWSPSDQAPGGFDLRKRF